MTPRGGSTPLATPMRDGLSINEGLTAEEAIEMGSKRAQKRKRDAFKKKLASGLSALPKATNEYMLVKPDLPPEVDDQVANDVNMEEDAEDAMMRIEEQAQAMEDAILRKRHTVIQRTLPRPTNLNVEMGGDGDEDAMVAELIRKEMVAMIRYDAYHHPLVPEEDGKKKKKKNKKKEDQRAPKLDMFEEDELRAAKEMIMDEASKMETPLKSRKPTSMKDDSDDDSDDDEPPVSSTFVKKSWAAAHDGVMFLPSMKAYGALESVSEADRIKAVRQEFTLSREILMKDIKKATKMEQRMNLLTGGYRQRAQALKNTISETHETLNKCLQERGCFDMLYTLELKAIPQRCNVLEKEVAILEGAEAKLQIKYAKLTAERTKLKALLASAKK